MSWIETGSSICFKPYTLEEALHGLSEAGFENVEIGAVKGFLEHLDPDRLGPREIDETRRLLDRFGQRCVSLSGHASLHLEEGMRRLRNVLAAAKELDALVLNTFTGDAETPEEVEQFKANARVLADEAQAAGIRLCIETDSNLLPTAEIGMRLLDEIGHDWIQINYDPGNVVYYVGARPEEDLRSGLGRYGHVHLKDQRGGKGVLDFPALGEGEIDLASILRDLAASGFSGPVSMEIEFTDYAYPPWEECVEAARRGKRYWHSLDVATATARDAGRLVTTFDIASYVRDQPLYDVHEHHMPETLHDREVGLLKLLEQSYAGWTQARPYPLSPDDEPFALPPERPCTWKDVACYVDGSGSNAFVTSLVSALAELYGLGDDGITEDSWEELDHEIRRRHGNPGWVDDVIARAGIERIVTDPFSNILLDARASLGPRYRSVARINCLAVGWHADSHDHNGNSAHGIAAALDAQVDSFDDYLSFLERFVDTLPDRGQVALKSALAYDRDLRFDEPDEGLARRAFGKRRPSPTEQKAFGDFVVDRLCALAAERDVPMQMHLGTALIRGSHPMFAAGLVERHPGTRFLLMHLGYPWSRDVLGMAFVYRNIWLDLTWSFLLSPSHFKLALHEAIEILPDESRLMLGGDAWHVEESYGALALGRRLIGEVLHERLHARFLSEEGSRRLARRILHGNARAFFGYDDG